MAKFNTVSIGTKTVNRAGGKAYAMDSKLKLVTFLLTSMVKDQFYRDEATSLNEIEALVGANDPLFVAKATIYARKTFGMRSISHVVASELAQYVSGQPWASDFYRKVINRPDDILEILSYHKAKNGKITNAMKKGMGAYLAGCDAYQLAKYKGSGKNISLVDAVNLLHPKPTEDNALAFKALMDGTLAPANTWESRLSAGEDKGETWADLIRTNALGYFALLRNLRNIVKDASDDVFKLALKQLQDRTRIKKSLVFPFRFISAYNAIADVAGTRRLSETLSAISKAVDISLDNVPRFEGRTLVVLDDSESMTWSKNRDGMTPAQIGALFATVLAKTNDADLMFFANTSRWVNINKDDSTLTIANSYKFSSGGTNFGSIFPACDEVYERVIILSDMQGWMGGRIGGDFDKYRQRTGANPFVYSINLQGYGSLQLPQDRVMCLAGFSDKIFDTMKAFETDRGALVKEISSVELG